MKNTRYSAKLLFRYRLEVKEGEQEEKRPFCIESILTFAASSPREALRHAKRRGKEMGNLSYKSQSGRTVHFDFMGVMDLMDLGVETQKDEVWYDVRRRLMTESNKKRLLPDDRKLLGKVL